MVDAPVRIVSNTWPRLIVATGLPLTLMVVLFWEARNRNVSPFRRVASGSVTNVLPHVETGGISSSMWSQNVAPDGTFAH